MNPSKQTSYAAPVDQLLSLGELEESRSWRDYPSLGLTHADIPELTRMATDPKLLEASEGDAMWAPIHAWRALAQLHATEAIEPLTGLLHRIDDVDDDWAQEDLPIVFGQLGAEAIEPLQRYLADSQKPEYARIAAADGLKQVGRSDRSLRDRCTGILADQLRRFAENPITLNTLIVGNLVELGAKQHATVIEQAYAARRVDTDFARSWREVQQQLGLKPIDGPIRRGLVDPLELAIERALPPSPEPDTPQWMKEFLQ
jgi:hypothetical protein